MALGGGTFTVQNKVLPGAYINFVSKAKVSATLSERGYAAVALALPWGPEEKVFTVTSGDFIKNSLSIFGYRYDDMDDVAKLLRDLFKNASILYCYRLSNGSKKATGKIGSLNIEALYSGTLGNFITVKVEERVDGNYDVITSVKGSKVDEQTVSSLEDFVTNDYIALSGTISEGVVSLTGGVNGEVTGTDHQNALNAFESYAFNAIGYIGTDDITKALYAEYTKRMREKIGAKFQCVLYNYKGDHEGIINVKNKVTDSDNEASIVAWIIGAEAGCAVNKTISNAEYDGEFIPDTSYTQEELERCIKDGELVLHNDSDNILVLEDINSLVTSTPEKGDDFKSNQVIRVLDQIAIDIAGIFKTKYFGEVPNKASGRLMLWGDITSHHKKLEDINALDDFDPDDITVEQGETKKSVVVTDAVTPAEAMTILYMTVIVQ